MLGNFIDRLIFLRKEFWLALCLFVPLLLKGEEYTDTVGIIQDAKNVAITSEAGKIKVYCDIVGEDGKDSFYYYSKERSEPQADPDALKGSYYNKTDIEYPFASFLSDNESIISGDEEDNRTVNYLVIGDQIYGGLHFNYFDKDQIRNGWEAGVESIIGMGWHLGKSGTNLLVGAGWGMKRFSAATGSYFTVVNNVLKTENQNDAFHDVSSSLYLFSIHLPLRLRQKIGKHFMVTVGWTFDLNFYANAKTSYITNDATHKINYKGLQQKFLTGHLSTTLSIWGIGIYGSWYPLSVFRGSYGPKLKGWSIGLVILTK